ncbi:hypothetical protein BS639_22515 [Rouxiella silvae]|uniref:Uncharacterized protein n=1 Tax=Rouxiella silvae TaxID=1646373 RepID=A0ABX3TV22_9GAMM|nr:hypothetical protein [Rouxiella silvae]ORJ18964.1 hypothetical protein BS639_22515 [Rouxiella silvae]
MHDFKSKMGAAGLWLSAEIFGPTLFEIGRTGRNSAECHQDMTYLAWNENASGNAAKWWIEHLKEFDGFANLYSRL